jgi:hypothetical protein
VTHEAKNFPAALAERAPPSEQEPRASAELAPYREAQHEVPAPTTELESAFAALTSELRGEQRVAEIQRLIRGCYTEMMRPGQLKVSYARLKDTIEALEMFETGVVHELPTSADWGVYAAAILAVAAALSALLPSPYGLVALVVGCIAGGWAGRKAREAARIHFCAQRVGVLSGAIVNARDRLTIGT